ncbi:hypothetical protein CRG98_050095 [Punica granatum]|uniref:Uncharacterized protein n=1 Tax=Punica granatum TaxID=22663 RepID=A0A2I0GT49_PUNGR|nr:hypothetical protein CRG98_050095 [Punica granatum]
MTSGDSFSRASVVRPREGEHSQAALQRRAHACPDETKFGCAHLPHETEIGVGYGSMMNSGLAISSPTFTQGSRETWVGWDLRPDPNPWFSCINLVEARIRRAQTREKKMMGSLRSVAHDLEAGFANLGRSHP